MLSKSHQRTLFYPVLAPSCYEHRCEKNLFSFGVLVIAAADLILGFFLLPPTDSKIARKMPNKNDLETSMARC